MQGASGLVKPGGLWPVLEDIPVFQDSGSYVHLGGELRKERADGRDDPAEVIGHGGRGVYAEEDVGLGRGKDLGRPFGEAKIRGVCRAQASQDQGQGQDQAENGA